MQKARTGNAEHLAHPLRLPGSDATADNIVWGGNDQDGYHSSHLICTYMTNLGPSEFGPATGRRAKIHVIAHCVCKHNRIVEEWLVRDNYALAEQLGFDPLSYAREQAAKPIDPGGTFARWLAREHERVRVVGRDRLAYPAAGEDRESFVRAALHNIWNGQMLGDCRLLYADNARLHASAREDYDGVDQVTRFYVDIMGAMPDARISVDYTCSKAMRDGEFVAARWVIAGTHTGSALWGDASNAPLVILGESQYRLFDGRVVEEWLVFDELAVLTQVERARLASERQPLEVD